MQDNIHINTFLQLVSHPKFGCVEKKKVIWGSVFIARKFRRLKLLQIGFHQTFHDLTSVDGCFDNNHTHVDTTFSQTNFCGRSLISENRKSYSPRNFLAILYLHRANLY